MGRDPWHSRSAAKQTTTSNQGDIRGYSACEILGYRMFEGDLAVIFPRCLTSHVSFDNERLTSARLRLLGTCISVAVI